MTHKTAKQLVDDSYKTVGAEKVKKKIVFKGFKIHLDQPAGSSRTWTYDDGRAPFTAHYKHNYGFFPGVKGRDGDDLDVYVGPDKKSDKVFIWDKLKSDGKTLDEHKVMLGFNTTKLIKKDILDTMKMQKMVGPIKEISMGELKRDWLKNAAYYSGRADAFAKFGGASAAGPDGASSYRDMGSPVATTSPKDRSSAISRAFRTNANIGQTSNFTEPGNLNATMQGGTPTKRFTSDTSGGQRDT